MALHLLWLAIGHTLASGTEATQPEDYEPEASPGVIIRKGFEVELGGTIPVAATPPVNVKPKGKLSIEAEGSTYTLSGTLSVAAVLGDLGVGAEFMLAGTVETEVQFSESIENNESGFTKNVLAAFVSNLWQAKRETWKIEAHIRRAIRNADKIAKQNTEPVSQTPDSTNESNEGEAEDIAALTAVALPSAKATALLPRALQPKAKAGLASAKSVPVKSKSKSPKEPAQPPPRPASPPPQSAAFNIAEEEWLNLVATKVANMPSVEEATDQDKERLLSELQVAWVEKMFEAKIGTSKSKDLKDPQDKPSKSKNSKDKASKSKGSKDKASKSTTKTQEVKKISCTGVKDTFTKVLCYSTKSVLLEKGGNFFWDMAYPGLLPCIDARNIETCESKRCEFCDLMKEQLVKGELKTFLDRVYDQKFQENAVVVKSIKLSGSIGFACTALKRRIELGVRGSLAWQRVGKELIRQPVQKSFYTAIETPYVLSINELKSKQKRVIYKQITREICRTVDTKTFPAMKLLEDDATKELCKIRENIFLGKDGAKTKNGVEVPARATAVDLPMFDPIFKQLRSGGLLNKALGITDNTVQLTGLLDKAVDVMINVAVALSSDVFEGIPIPRYRHCVRVIWNEQKTEFARIHRKSVSLDASPIDVYVMSQSIEALSLNCGTGARRRLRRRHF